MPRLKAGTVIPTASEDKRGARAIAADPDTYELAPHEFAELRPQPKRGRPVAENPKRHVNIRLSGKVVDYFKGQGAGWQTRIDRALSDWIDSRKI